MNMNINEAYGNVELPSEIADSFQQDDSHSSIKEQHEIINMGGDIKHSRYLSQDLIGQNQSIGQQSDICLESSVDTFLANLPNFIQNQAIKNTAQQDDDGLQIAINKTKIFRNVLPKQELVQFIQIINSSNKSIVLSVCSPNQIQVLSLQSFVTNLQNNLNSTNSKDFYLDPWQKIQVGFRIQKSDEQFGDIYETISLQYKYQQKKKKTNYSKKKRAFIEVEVHYIIPKLKINYQGSSDVVTICLNKISVNKIAKNKLGEYCLMLGLNGVQRLQCSVEARGDIRVFPRELLLFKSEFKKLTFKQPSSKGVIIIKIKNTKVNFLFVVQLI